MIAIVTFFEKNQQPGNKADFQEPVSFQSLCYGITAFDHCVNQLIELGVKYIYVATDKYKKEIESSIAYQKLSLTSFCSILQVKNDKEIWQELFCNFGPELGMEDLLWFRGDFVIPFSILKELTEKKRNGCITVYPEARPGATQQPIPFSNIINESAFIFPETGGPAGIQVFFIKSNSRKVLERFYKEDPDIWEFRAEEILLEPCLSAYCAIPVLSKADETLFQSLLVVDALEKPVMLNPESIARFQEKWKRNNAEGLFLIWDKEAEGELQSLTASLKFAQSLYITPETSESILSDVKEAISGKEILVCGGTTAVGFAQKLQRIAKGNEYSFTIAVSQEAFLPAIQMCDADVYVRTESLSVESRQSLYAFTLTQTLFTLLSRDRTQSEETLLSHLATDFFQSPKRSDFVLLHGAKVASALKMLRGKTTLDNIAAAMGETLEMPEEFAGTYFASTVVLWLGKNIQKIYPFTERKMVAESISELLIMLNLKNCEEVFSLSALVLAGAGLASVPKQLKAVNSKIKSAVEHYCRAFDMTADRTKEPEKGQPRRTIISFTEKVFDEMFAMADKEKSLFRFAEQELALVSGTFPTQMDITVSQMVRRIWQDRLEDTVREVQKALLYKVLTFCSQKGLDCWLKTDQESVKEGSLFSTDGCCLLMKPWDVDILLAELPAFLTENEALCTDITPFPSLFADVFLYRKNTEIISRWNIDAKEMPRQAGIAIQRLLPGGEKYFKNYKKSLKITKILAARQGYCLPLMGVHYVRVKEGLLWTCPKEVLAEKRKELLSLPADTGAHWQKSFFWDEEADAPVAIGAENTGTVFLQDKGLNYVFASSYSNDNIWYKVKLGKGEEYILADADVQVHFSDSPSLLVKLPFWCALSKMRRMKEYLRELKPSRQELRDSWLDKKKNIKAHGKRLLFTMLGLLSRFGLCVPESRRILKAYRNKYAGQRCFLIGNGPSLQASDLELLKNEITFGCNYIHKIYLQTDWRPTFHCLSDSSTVRMGGWDIVSNLAEDKTTMIIRDFTFDKMPIKPKNVLVAPSVSMEDYYVSKDFLAFHYISHATVMSMMVEAAMYMGFSEIYLLGVDATTSSDKGGNFTANYFTPEQRKKLDAIKKKVIKDYDVNKRRAEIADRQQMVYQLLRQSAEERGIHIYNATRGGALEVYERVNLDDIVINKS